MTWILMIVTLTFSGASSRNVPVEAYTLADDILAERWRPSATTSPDIYGLKGLDPAKARTSEPFRELELRGHNLDDYLNADVDDPTGFAGVEKYCFPLLIGDHDAGAIIIIRNRDENGFKFSPEYGDFMLFGYYLPDDVRVVQVRQLQQIFPKDTEIVWVWFVDAGVRPQVVVKSSDGQVYAGVSADTLNTIAIAGPSIRSAIRSARGVENSQSED